jgi:putative tryptophan/tyrosine transport system substrate-binding protein
MMVGVIPVLVAFALAVSQSDANAQQPTRVPRIGILCAFQCGTIAIALPDIMGQRGYVEGKNIVVDLRGAGVSDDQLPRYAAELARRKVDIILAVGTSSAVLAAKKVTGTIPIVMAIGDDAVESGLVASLSRPGGNITGVMVPQTELLGKQLQLLKEAAPQVSRVGLVSNPSNPAHRAVAQRVAGAAESLRVHIALVEVRGPVPDFDSALSGAVKSGTDALLVLPDFMLTRGGNRLGLIALQKRLPTVSTFNDFVSGGGLMAYGPSFPDMVQSAWVYVDKILKGAKPGDLPVEQPTKYELIVNLSTAKAVGLTIPPSLLVRADKVIQ